MYLSQLILNPRSRQVQSEIALPYEMHRTISQAFPAKLPTGERLLFRLDVHPRTSRLQLLVQSQGLPDWSFFEVDGKRGYLEKTCEPNPQCKPYHPDFQAGQPLVFRLRANPTIKRNGKRHALYREDEQKKWLERKSIEAGFRLSGIQVWPARDVHSPLFRDGHRHELKLHVVNFDGLLVVDDPALFFGAVRSGLGSGKGFGCGLLSVALPSI